MKIAMTYDLRKDPLYSSLGEEEAAEYDSIETIEGIENALKKLGHQPERIGHIQNLVQALAEGKRWDLVFNFSEGRHGRCRESQIPALLDAYAIPYTFSDALTLAYSMDKSLTKRIVSAHGVNTAPFKVVEKMEDLFPLHLPFPLFAKPLSEGSSIGIHAQSCIRTPAELKEVCAKLLTQFQQPVLLETYLPKREFTVGIIGTGASAEVIGVMEIVPRPNMTEGGYTLNTKKNYEKYVDYILVDDAEAQIAAQQALLAYRVLNCRDAARIDFRSDDKDIPQFLEINPLAGLNPLLSDLVILCRLKGIAYDELIASIVHFASERVPQAAKHELSTAGV